MSASMPSDGRRVPLSPRDSRQLGADYMYAFVMRDIDGLARLKAAHSPEDLAAGLAITCRAMIMHIAELEATTADVVASAYRDVWAGTTVADEAEPAHDVDS